MVVDATGTVAERGNLQVLREEMHVVEAGRDHRLGRASADAGDALLHRGEEWRGRRAVTGEIFGDFLDGDAALRNFRGGLLEEGAEFALGGGEVLGREHAAVDGEAGERGHGVDLAALAGGEDTAEVERRMQPAAIGRAKSLAGEDFLVAAEGEHEGGHFLEGVDAFLRHGAMGGFAVHDDVEPNDAVVAAADGGAFAAFADDGVISAQLAMVDDPIGAEEAVGFFVGDEGDLDIAARSGASGAEGRERVDDAGDGALHVGGAAAVNPAAIDDGVERVAVLPLAADGHDVVVGVEVDGLLRAGVPEGDHVGARVAELVGLGFLLQRARDFHAAHVQAEVAQSRGEQLGGRGVVFAGRIDRAEADELLEEGD